MIEQNMSKQVSASTLLGFVLYIDHECMPYIYAMTNNCEFRIYANRTISERNLYTVLKYRDRYRYSAVSIIKLRLSI